MLKKIPFQYRISILYIFLSAIWILFSDRFVVEWTSDPSEIQTFSTYKGWFFVLITGTLLFLLIRREIRHRNQLYNELLEAKKKADESDRLKTTFLANLSHYIRTPMNSILGFVELIEGKDISPANQEIFLRYINQSSQNLLQTLSSIVEISKIQEGLTRISLQKIMVNQVIERIAENARIDISTQCKPLIIKTCHGLPEVEAVISSDQDRILLILSNLVSNSIQFSEQGEIEIGYRAVGSEFIFWVKDNGKGIPDEKKNSLFTSFLQNTSGTNIVGEGAGLGLVLSAQLAILLGGYLWLESSGPLGTTFCLKIPGHSA